MAVALIALGVTAFFVVRAEQQLAARRADAHAFDRQASELTSALSDLRAGQQAYVAAGQGVAFWMPKVAQTADAVRTSVMLLRAMAAAASTREAIDAAMDAVAEFGEVDARARDYLRSGQLLMAGDIIFTEGNQSAATAGRYLEQARLAERQALADVETTVRRQEAAAIAAVTGLSALILALLGATAAAPSGREDAAEEPTAAANVEAPVPAAQAPDRVMSPALRTAAQLCTDFACMRDINDLQLLLTRASDIMDASGLVVWLGTADGGGDLQPVLTQGYSEETRARLPNVPRSANNAAAAAYRSGDVQIVLSRPGGSKGAIVVPIRGVQGCVGALSIETRGGTEASESVQALASIVAAQLAGVLAANPHTDAVEARAAASS